MSVGKLIAPEGDDEILDADPEALAYKPVMTGDVFVGVTVIGEELPIDVMVAGHPCTIRRGVSLVERVPCVRLVEHQWFPYESWPRRDQRHFPISAAAGLGTGRCASLFDWVSIPSAELVRSRRRLTLQDQGIYIFLQRLIHSFSRFAPPISTLREASGHVLAEAELEYTWVLDLYEGDPDSPELVEVVREFDDFLGSDGRRDVLATDRRRVATEVAAEIRRRQSASI